jgi:hypothetical protein
MKVTKIHFDIYNKILFAVLGILLITWFSVYVMNFFKPRIKEGQNIFGGGGGGGILDGIKDLQFIKDIIENVEKAKKFFEGLDRLFNHGIPNHLACGKSMADSGFNGGLQVLNIQFMCFWDKFVKFFKGDCTLYYMIDAISKLLTIIFIRLPLTIIKAIFGIDLHFLVDMFKSIVLVPLNELFIIVVGFGFLNWSDTIIEKCYRCQGQIKNSNGSVIYSGSKSFDEWAKLYKCTDALLKNGINKIFFSAFPSDHWKTWYDTDKHLEGGDDSL